MTSTTKKPIAVAYPGRDGAHSAAACRRLFPTGAELRALPSFLAVAEATAGGEVDFGVLPIESSLAGSVAETHDLLHEYPLSIVAETALRIRHCLVALGDVPLEEIKLVRSHPVALDQCRALVAGMPWATAIAAATTADAARQVAESGDSSQAAISSERAAQLHGLTVVAGDVGDHPEAYTRFVSISTYTFVTDHSPGALYRAIEPFGRLRIDLHQLVSRPIPRTPWRYRFDAVLAGHPLDPIVNEALRELQERTRRLQVFGSYPARRDVEEE
jgi:prephenate dehydratase